MTDFNGKTAFVTGAGSGLGRAMAGEFARRGANVMLADIKPEGLEETAQSLSNLNVGIETILCDVADVQAIRAAADATVERFGKVHIIANNAGVGLSGETGSIPIEDWRWIVDINLMGVVHGVEVFTPLIRSHGEGGHILNTASMAGHVSPAGMGPYNATKFAVVGYSESIAAELTPQGIGVSCLCPGWVNTQIHTTGFNAPSRGGETPDTTDPAFQQMAAVIGSGLSPDDVAAWTADSMEAGRLYVFTHSDMKIGIDMRAQQIAADYQAILDDGRFS